MFLGSDSFDLLPRRRNSPTIVNTSVDSERQNPTSASKPGGLCSFHFCFRTVELEEWISLTTNSNGKISFTLVSWTGIPCTWFFDQLITHQDTTAFKIPSRSKQSLATKTPSQFHNRLLLSTARPTAASFCPSFNITRFSQNKDSVQEKGFQIQNGRTWSDDLNLDARESPL